MTNLLGYLEETIKTHADKTAFAGENGSMTFGSIYEQARRIGSFQAETGHCIHAEESGRNNCFSWSFVCRGILCSGGQRDARGKKKEYLPDDAGCLVHL